MNLRLMLEKTARQYGSKTAIISSDQKLSYAELDEASNKVANALLEMGAGKGKRVAMLLPNSPEFIIIYFGIVKAGAIAVPLDIRYKVNELDSLFNNCQPKVLVTEGSTLKPILPALPRFKSIEHIIDLNSEHDGQFLSYQQIIATSPPKRVEVKLEPDDIANIAYTSGPTGHPKGVMLSHHSLVTEAIVSSDGIQQTDKDIMMLFALPLVHALGLESVLLASTYKGSTVVIVPGTGLSIGTLMEAIERENGTVLTGVPYIFALAVNMAEKEGIKSDLSSLRLCCSAGAPLPINTIRRFKKHYSLDVIDAYGLTEAVCLVTCSPIDGSGKPGSCGKTLRGWEVKIVGDNSEELLPNQPGEVIVRGPIMKGYYNNPRATAETIKNGWLYTGDIGRLDEDGFLFILGRKKEMILVKGQNIYPSDIEEILYTHPKVAEAAVVGIPDELRGEIIRAVVSLKYGEVATEQEVRRFCLERMANYKVPKQIIFRDSLPKTTTGKIRKEDLRDYLLTLSP